MAVSHRAWSLPAAEPWLSTDAPPASHAGPRRLHHFFERRCDATPDATALVCDGQRLTYRQLDRRANRLAAHLTLTGIGTGDAVGILLHRSV